MDIARRPQQGTAKREYEPAPIARRENAAQRRTKAHTEQARIRNADIPPDFPNA